jgi:hypothetical protein
MRGRVLRVLVCCMAMACFAAAAEAQSFWDMLGKVQDTSDLPTWTGKQLKLVEWYAHGTGLAEHLRAENDVVTPEAKRVTGVELDAENSYDNGLQTIDLKLSLLAASGDWPDIILTTGPKELQELVKAGKLYDLTELLPKYCPDLLKIYDPKKFPEIMKRITAEVTKDRIFFVPLGAGRELTYEIYKNKPEFSMAKYARILPPSPMCDWQKTWVRDDILKKMYPKALTQDEIEALYEKNGSFTKEQIFDVPIRSAKDFAKFLRDMKALIAREGIKENGKPVEVIWGANGADNWPVMACLLPQMYGVPTVDYFTYYDKKVGKIVYTFKQPWFKSMISDYQKLVSEGIVSKESLIDNDTIFTEKLNSGQYAISFAWLKPDEAKLKAAGKTYRYRLLWPDVTYNYTQFAELQGPRDNWYNIGIFKDSVAAEDLPQILRYLNYMASDIGSKLTNWGPRSAGLFTEKNGIRTYTDAELELNMCYDVDNKANVKYNLYSYNIPTESYRAAFPPYPLGYAAGLNHPKYVYPELKRSGNAADTYFQPGMLPGLAREDRFIFVDRADFLPHYADQWNLVSKGRGAFENTLTATLTAKDNAQFEKLWATMLETAAQIGLTDKTLGEVNQIFTQLSPNAVKEAAKIKK